MNFRWLRRLLRRDWRWWLGLKPAFLAYPVPRRTISVVIPAYNEEKSIAQTVTSIRNQSVTIDEIIVVDDCSSDRTSEVALQAGARVVRTAVNQGTKAMAQNYVLSQITTELVVTIDGDTILHPDAIARTLPYLNDPKCASVCGFVVPQQIKSIWERGRFVEYLFGISVFKAAQNHVQAVLVSSGCFSTFRTKALRILGGFKQRTMAEDMDFTWEATLKGYTVYCAPDAYCYPLDPQTAQVFINQVDRWSRSFFQNITIHRNGFRKNKKLAAFIFGYLVEGLLSPLVIPALLFAALRDFPVALLLTLATEFAIVGICSLWAGARRGMFWVTLASLPAYFVIKPVNFWLFWRSLYKEWIIGERLTQWHKGH